MSELLIWNGLQALLVREGKPQQGWSLQKENDAWWIVHDQKRMFLQPKTVLSLDGSLVLMKDDHKAPSIYPAEDFVLSRDLCSDSSISKRHFQIRRENNAWILQDLKSTNGTWLNGARVERAALKDGDWIFAGKSLFFFQSGLIFSSDLPVHAAFEKEASLFEEKNTCLPLAAPVFEKASIQVDSASINKPAQSAHWFSVIGPSLLMGASSLASCMAMLSMGRDAQSIFPTILSSLSMSAGFLMYGLINRSISKRNQIRSIEEQKQEYQSYARTLYQQCLQMLARHDQILSDYLEEAWKPEGHYRQFASSEWKLPIFGAKEAVLDLHLPASRYNQSECEELISLRSLDCMRESLDWLEQSKSLCLPGLSMKRAGQLFDLWSWSCWNEQRKWLWLTKDRPEDCTHPACRIDDQTLWFDQVIDAQRLIEAHPEMEWTIFTDQILPSFSSSLSITCITTLSQPGIPVGRLPHLEKLVASEKRQARLTLPKPLVGSLWDERMQERNWSASSFRKKQANLTISLSAGVLWNLETDGPHVMVAGSTGSGKSEGLLCILLQLALNNSPKQVQIITVDYKGNALAGALRDLPHLCGQVSNLDQRGFDRLQCALKEELASRQQRLAQFGRQYPYESQDLSSYNAKMDEPMSHLVVVIDEFAQLKKNAPESMASLQEIARIGRSLGLHLIMATQKPAGVVDEQIWSNCTSRLCFKVSSNADSREMLGHDLAARLKNPGEFILQIGAQNQEKSGRIWYLRKPLRPSSKISEISRQGAVLWQNRQDQSALEEISSKIASLHQKGTTFLHPDLTECSFENAPILLDQISSVKEEKPEPGKLWWWASTSEILLKAARTLAMRSTLPVLAFGFGELEGADQSLDLSCLWQLEELDQDALVLISEEKALDEDLLRRIKTNTHLCLMIFASSLSCSKASLVALADILMISSVKDKDYLYTLLNTLSTPVMSAPFWSRFESMEESVCLLDSKPQKENRKRKQLIRALKNPMSVQDLLSMESLAPLGFYARSGRPFFVPKDRGVTLVCSTSKARSRITDLVQIWKNQDPMLSVGPLGSGCFVELADLPADQASLMLPQNAASLMERNIVYVGKGIQSHAFLLKVTAPLDVRGDTLFFDEEGALDLNITRFERSIHETSSSNQASERRSFSPN